jgi:hypothetical protein
MFVAPHRDLDALPAVLGALGVIVAFIAWRVSRPRNWSASSTAGDDIGDIAPMHHDHGHDCDGGADE